MIEKNIIKPTDKLIFDMEMCQIDYNEQKKESLRKEISEKYNVPLKNVVVNFIPVTTNSEGDSISLTTEVINNIQDPLFQRQLFKEMIELRGYDDVDFDSIIDIDNKVNAFVDFDAYGKYKPYKVKYLKWDNYLSYGKGNFFDFTKLNGLVLLSGEPENQSGKTTLAIDLLRFALFGKAAKSPTLDAVFNIYLEEETEVVVETCIEIEKTDYVIRRTISRPSLKKRTKKSKAKQKVEFFKLVNGSYEEIENCEGESGTQTNNIIKETVGNVEDFDLVISATAYTLGDIMRMGQTDKGKLFSRWLGLLSLEEKQEISKEIWKKESQKLISSKYNKMTLESEINDMKTIIENDNKYIIETQDKLNLCNANIEKYNNEKMSILKKRKEIKETLIDATTVENKLKMVSEELQKHRNKMMVKKERYMEIKDSKFNNDDFQKVKAIEDTIKANQIELRTKITSLRDENKRIGKLIEGKICPTCGQEIDMVEQNNLISSNEEKIKDFTAKGLENKIKLEEINAQILKLEQQRNEENELNRLKPEMSAIKVQIDNCKLQITELNRQKVEIETNKDNIKVNNEIENKIRIVDTTISEENRNKEYCIREIEKCKAEIKNYETEIKRRNEIISKLFEEEKIIRSWNCYQELVGKNGIIKLVLKRALPIVNNEIARLLDGLCDFDVILSVDDTNKMCLDLVRDGKSIDLGMAASGWEGCVASIAIRCALSNLGNLPKGNFTVYDEVLSGVSSKNVENVMKLFGRVLNKYDFIIHICHDTTLMDYHNQIIVVTKENNVSKIQLR